jgi:hypothetical protein
MSEVDHLFLSLPPLSVSNLQCYEGPLSPFLAINDFETCWFLAFKADP